MLKDVISVLYILDSFRIDSLANEEGRQLQTILLQHFEGESFKEGRISTNVAKVILFFLSNNHYLIDFQVPIQHNTKDCGCFLIYFARKFFQNPGTTLELIKVRLSLFSEDNN